MRPRVVVAVVVVAVVGAGALLAGPVSPSGTAVADIGASIARAQAALSSSTGRGRDWPAVIAALSEGLRLARAEAPLQITRAVVVDGPHTGLGVYAPSVGGVVRDRRLRLYVEVENLVARPLTDGRSELSLDVAGHFSAVASDGSLEALGKKTLGAQQVRTFRPIGVHSFGVDVALGLDAPAGAYVIELEVVDRIGGKSARIAVPFAI